MSTEGVFEAMGHLAQSQPGDYEQIASICRKYGLIVEGDETLAELMEAVSNLFLSQYRKAMGVR